MEWITLDNPRVRQTPGLYKPFEWPVGAFHPFAPIENDEDACFLSILSGRRTKRTFNTLSDTHLGHLLWHCARTQAIAESDYGFDLELRPSPSAGAIHPIHILVDQHGTDHWRRYDSRKHGLMEIPGSSDALHGLGRDFQSTLTSQTATRLLLLAEPGKARAKYEHCESLIWRDAGALLGIMGLVSEALGCSFCPLGITGEPWASQLSSPGMFAGVGVALVGDPALKD